MSGAPRMVKRPATAEAAVAGLETFCHHICGRYHPPVGYEYDDLMQRARLGVFKAWNAYRPETGVPFYNYAGILIENEIRRLLKREKAIMRRAQNEAVSYDRPVSDDHGAASLGDLVLASDETNPEQQALTRERFTEMLNRLRTALPPDERRVYIAIAVDGMSQEEVADALGLSRQRISQIFISASARLDDETISSRDATGWALEQGWHIGREDAA